MQNSYTVINASAGSGKTYALVQRLLMVCLEYPNQNDAIRHILALTFTNKAANEMKSRILEWLKNFASDDYIENNELKNIQGKFAETGIKITLDDLHFRSKKVLDYILHHYSTLNIGTIDKFNSRLVRSFSYELGLSHNFNLEIQPEPFLIEAVDKMLDEIGENEQVSDAFMDFVNYHLDNNERVNLNKTLYGASKEFIQDKHYRALKSNEDFNWISYEETKNQIRKEIKNLKNDSLKIAQETIELLQNRNLEIEDFAGGKQNSLAKFFFETIRFLHNERDFPFPSNEATAQETFAKGTSAKSKNKEAEIFEILETLLDNRNLIIQNYISSQKKEKILRALLPLRVHKDIQQKLSEIEDENDLVLLSKFNILINENLQNEPSSFIYEKVGTQYQHYFFDEFQDTSELQWNNFLPLRDHAISSENTTFTLVGDPKQSIYRFRGGDSQLMLDIIHQKEKRPAKVENLQYNFRSGKNIVEFNNRLYQFMSNFVSEEYRDIFGIGAQQIPNADFMGNVRANFIENNIKQEFYREVAIKMQEDIQQCLHRGYHFSDIAILCRGNYDIYTLSQLLGNLKVQYDENETFIKTISEKGLTLDLSSTILAVIEFLNWELNPKNRQFLVRMMYFLNELGRIRMKDFTAEMMEILALEEKPEIEEFILKKYRLALKENENPTLNLYNFIEYFVQEFSVENKETDFVLNFLEMLYNFSQNAGFALKDFLKFWDEEGSKISIQASENIDAIQIMTIHKAKGLEFPVVLLPMENTNKDGKFQNWLDLENESELKSVNISGFEPKLEEYDESIKNFNEENVEQNKIDRFCLQYVATTRPVEQLFLYIEKPNKTANQLEIYDFLKQFQPENNVESFDIFETEGSSLKKQSKKKTNKHTIQEISTLHHAFDKNSSIKIATPSKNYQTRNSRVRNGIFVHEILGKINSVKDVEVSLENYLLDGTITKKEKDEIKNHIEKVIEKFPDYFSESIEVMNEREIMISEKGEMKIYRPDRMTKQNDEWTIIDFKTGENDEKSKKTHQKQINNYKKILENLGKKVIKTEIVYL